LAEVGVVATGYVLVMAVTGPVLARFVEPLSARLGALPQEVVRRPQP
jgi:CPA2 family monovalent cation:H+ antiporter-2